MIIPLALASHFFFTFFTATVLLLFLPLFAGSFPFFILTSFSFSFHPFLVSPLLAHQQLGFKTKLVSFWSDTIFGASLNSPTTFSQELFLPARVYFSGSDFQYASLKTSFWIHEAQLYFCVLKHHGIMFSKQ